MFVVGAVAAVAVGGVWLSRKIVQTVLYPGVHLTNDRVKMTFSFGVPICTFRPSNADEKKNLGWIVYSHGNGETIDNWNTQKCCQQLADRTGYSVLTYEYPEYGAAKTSQKTIKISQDSIKSNMMRAVEYLESEEKANANDIVFYGLSLGSGPAAWAASRWNQCKGLILVSAHSSVLRIVCDMTSLPRMACSSIVPRSARWDNLKSLSNVKCPVLIVHGQDDNLIGVQHARENRAATKHAASKMHVDPNGSHNLDNHFVEEHVCVWLDSL